MRRNIFVMVLLSLMLLVGYGEAKEAPQGILEATNYTQIQPNIGKMPMLLEFGSTSCASCVEMGKLLYRAKQEYPQSAIYFVEVYQDMTVTKNYKIQIIPTQIYLHSKGEEVDRHMGLVTYEQLIAKLKEEKII